jgi:hypothetical protein
MTCLLCTVYCVLSTLLIRAAGTSPSQVDIFTILFFYVLIKDCHSFQHTLFTFTVEILVD